MLLTVDCSVPRDSVRQLNIYQPDDGFEVTAVGFIGAGDTVGYYSRSLVWNDLGLLPQTLKQDGESVMHVTLGSSKACAIKRWIKLRKVLGRREQSG